MTNGETESYYLTHTHPAVIHTVSDTFSPVLQPYYSVPSYPVHARIVVVYIDVHCTVHVGSRY